MITLAKTHKPLHVMTDSELSTGYDEWNALVCTCPTAPFDNRWKAIRLAYAVEQWRRVRFGS